MRTTVITLCALFAAAALAASCSAANPRYVQVVRAVFGKDARDAICIVDHETANDPWNPWAWSATGDAGLFQINYQYHHAPGESVVRFRRRMADVSTNVAYAYLLFKSSGWRPWYTRKECGL